MKHMTTVLVLGLLLAAGIFVCSRFVRIPGTQAAAGPAGPRVMVDVVDGSRLVGTSVRPAVRLTTDGATLDVPWGRVVSIDAGRDSGTVVVATANGDRLTGALDPASLELDASFGRVSVGSPSLRQVRVFPPVRSLPDALRAGMLLYLSFDDGNASLTRDAGPCANHGQVRGAAWTPFGKSGGAYEFDGQKDYIELGPTDLYQPHGELSGGAWVFRQERALLVLSNYRGGGAYKGQFFFAIEGGGHLDVLMGQGPDQYVRYLSEDADLVPANAWHHLAFSYNEQLGDGRRIRLYVDGKDVGRYTIQREGTGGPVLQNGDRLRVMAHQVSGPNCFTRGKVDEVMLFSRALSADEVRQLYDAQK